CFFEKRILNVPVPLKDSKRRGIRSTNVMAKVDTSSTDGIIPGKPCFPQTNELLLWIPLGGVSGVLMGILLNVLVIDCVLYGFPQSNCFDWIMALFGVGPLALGTVIIWIWAFLGALLATYLRKYGDTRSFILTILGMMSFGFLAIPVFGLDGMLGLSM